MSDSDGNEVIVSKSYFTIKSSDSDELKREERYFKIGTSNREINQVKTDLILSSPKQTRERISTHEVNVEETVRHTLVFYIV